MRGDPGSGAWYGWRAEGWTTVRRRIGLRLPGPSPTGLIWAATGNPARTALRWYVPAQLHRGGEILLTLEAGTRIVAANPTAGRTLDCPRSPPRGEMRPCIVVLACQHPGEDIAERVCRRMQLAPRRNEAMQLTGIMLMPLVNASGRTSRHTRDTSEGIDLNRNWHREPSDAAVGRLRKILLAADFVVDLHADEHAGHAYTVAPAPCPPSLSATIDAFRVGFDAHCARSRERPRAIGRGEDHPGILVNWLAGHGVPAVMVELPMRLARSKRRPIAQDLRHAEARWATAVLAAIAAAIAVAGSSGGR